MTAAGRSPIGSGVGTGAIQAATAGRWRGAAATLAGLLLVAIVVRARDLGNPIVHVDEQYYLLVGDRMLHGAVPYIDLWDRKPLGLFLIFAAIRLLPGDGILAYQLAALVAAVATAGLVAAAGRRLGAGRTGAFLAGAAYILWLSFLSGRGGQSPVFYNLPMAAAGWLTLGLPALAATGRRGAIVAQGALVCGLAGLAIQVKYTPAVEGAFFGLAHCWYLRRAGGGIAAILAAAAAWIALALLPTVLVIGWYHRLGPDAFQAFWFANFTSIALRRGYPAAKIASRLAGTGAQLSPFVACAVAAWRGDALRPAARLAFGWLAAALIAFAMIGAFFDHYALPLMVPLAIVAAPVLGRRAWARWAMLAAALILVPFHLATEPDERASAFAIAAVMAAHDGRDCPYVFAGDSVLYLLARACVPTAYAFPSTLAYEPERGATGVDEAAEVARIMARRPPVVVTMDTPLAPWNPRSEAIVAAALARDYRLARTAPREDGRLLAYVRRDR